MKPAKFIYLFAAFMVVASISLAQEQEIDLLEPDLKLLEHYIKLHTDSVRIAHKLNSQEYDNTLYLAADDHAQYLLHHDKLSHFQQERMDKRKPSDRVNFYNGKFSYLSENLAQVSLVYMLANDKVLGSNFERVLWSYERTAQYIVDAWVNSPDHYANLINESSTHTAIAIQLDQQNGSLYVVQLFSKPKEVEIPKSELFPYRDVNLEPIDYSFLPESKINRRIARYGPYARKTQASLGAFSTNFKTARRLFRWHKRNSGLIFEKANEPEYYLNLSTSLSGNTRANGLDYYNSEPILSIKRKALFRQAKASLDLKKDYIHIIGIRLPFVKKSAGFTVSFPSGDFSDLLITDGKYPYYLIHSGNIPGGPYSLDFISFPYQSPIYEAYKPVVNKSSKTYSYQIYFQPNAIISKHFDETYEKMKEILKDPRMVLDTVYLNATASIEGDENANKQLFYQRARTIYDSLPAIYLGKKPVLKVQTKENWAMMAQQLKDSPYRDLMKQDKDSVRSFITNNRFDEPFRSWLDEQRFAFLELVVSTYDTVPNTLPTIEKHYFEAALDFVNNDQTKIKKDSLLTLQSAYFKVLEEKENYNIKRLPPQSELAFFRLQEVKYLLNKNLIQEEAAFQECIEMAEVLKAWERRPLEDLHLQLMVNLSLKNTYSNEEAGNLSYLDQYYRSYHKPKAYERWKSNESSFHLQSTLNIFYKRLMEKKNEQLDEDTYLHHLGSYYLRQLANEDRNSGLISPTHISYLSSFKNSYVEKRNDIGHPEALLIALFYNRYYQYNWALDILEKIPVEYDYGPIAAKVAASIYLTNSSRNPEEILENLYDKLGAMDWCEFMQNPAYYSYRKHLQYRARKRYCEICL